MAIAIIDNVMLFMYGDNDIGVINHGGEPWFMLDNVLEVTGGENYELLSKCQMREFSISDDTSLTFINYAGVEVLCGESVIALLESITSEILEQWSEIDAKVSEVAIEVMA